MNSTFLLPESSLIASGSGSKLDLIAAASMVQDDCLRENIPFLVLLPHNKDDLSEEQRKDGAEIEEVVADDQESAARVAIADVISSQQLKDVPAKWIFILRTSLMGINLIKFWILHRIFFTSALNVYALVS